MKNMYRALSDVMTRRSAMGKVKGRFGVPSSLGSLTHGRGEPYCGVGCSISVLTGKYGHGGQAVVLIRASGVRSE